MEVRGRDDGRQASAVRSPTKVQADPLAGDLAGTLHDLRVIGDEMGGELPGAEVR